MTNRLACLLGVLALLCLGCPKADDDCDEDDEGPYFIVPEGDSVPSRGPPTPLEVMEATCTWPCDAPGCIKAPGGKICQVRCKSDADCPAQSICVCEADGCSMSKREFIDEWPYTAENSCFPLLRGMENCRRKKNCCNPRAR